MFSANPYSRVTCICFSFYYFFFFACVFLSFDVPFFFSTIGAMVKCSRVAILPFHVKVSFVISQLVRAV